MNWLIVLTTSVLTNKALLWSLTSQSEESPTYLLRDLNDNVKYIAHLSCRG